MNAAPREFDLAVVGAGIIGLSCALAAARRKLRVVVIERNVRACGASVRNFGFVTVTGQDRETIWPRARRSRAIWHEVVGQAGRGVLIEAPSPTVRLVVVTSGIGASTGFAIGEEAINDLLK